MRALWQRAECSSNTTVQQDIASFHYQICTLSCPCIIQCKTMHPSHGCYGSFPAAPSLWFHRQEESPQLSDSMIFAPLIWTSATHCLQSWSSLLFSRELPRIRCQSLVGFIYPEQHFLGVMRWLWEWVTCKTWLPWGAHTCPLVLEKQWCVAGAGEGDIASVGAPCTPACFHPWMATRRPITEQCYVFDKIY